jgi:hypothetical protein
MSESTGKLAACATDLRRAGIHDYLASVIQYKSKNSAKYPRKLLHRLVTRLAPQISLHILLLATPAIAKAQAVNANVSSEYAVVDATVTIISYDTMEVKFNFRDAQNRPEYTVVKVGPKEDSQADIANPPFLLGKLSRSAITSSSVADHILVGVSGSGNSSAIIKIINFQAAGEASGKHSFQIGFLRYSALKRTTANSLALSIPGITYGQVTHVSVVKPDWSSEVRITDPSGITVTPDIGGTKSFDLKDEEVVSFDVVHLDSPVKRYSKIILDNVIFFTGTLLIGAIFAFLAPPRAHRAARILLGITAAVVGIWMVREIWLTSPQPDIENYAPLISAVLGLLVCIACFERLDKLVQLFGK